MTKQTYDLAALKDDPLWIGMIGMRDRDNPMVELWDDGEGLSLIQEHTDENGETYYSGIVFTIDTACSIIDELARRVKAHRLGESPHLADHAPE